MEYKVIGYRPNKLVKLDILINNEPAPPLALVVHADAAHTIGKKLTRTLKELIPRQMFKVPIQACVGSKVRFLPPHQAWCPCATLTREP